MNSNYIKNKTIKMITLKTLSQATEQEVFDQVSEHLLKQRHASTCEKGKCAYRGVVGLKCAAGCLIADDEYSKAFEHQRWNTLVYERKVPSAHKELIMHLQRIHDEDNPAYWGEGLKILARKRGLKFKFD